jgi:hypothetical protein
MASAEKKLDDIYVFLSRAGGPISSPDGPGVSTIMKINRKAVRTINESVTNNTAFRQTC